VWNYTGATLAFAVVPFFYQTLLFKLLMLLAFTLVVVVAARYVSFRRLRNRLRVLEQQSALYKERARIARDLHDDLGHGLTQIVLLSDLNAHDQVPAEELDGQLRQIAVTAKQGVKSLDETVWAINPRNDTLPDLIDYVGNFVVQSLRAAGLKCELDLPEQPPTLQVPSEVRHALFLVVKEAMNNVIRHAQANRVRLSITIANNAVALVIADDGRGGCPTNGNGHAGQDGLRNMQQRMQDIGGDFSLDSAPGMGTRISLTYRLTQPKSSNGVHNTVTK
jgi:signal transduction histidine kinase